MTDIPVPGFQKYWTQKLALQKSESHVITTKYPKAAAVVQQVYKVIDDTEILAGNTPTKVGESSEWTSIVDSAENRVNFCTGLDGKPLFSTLYGVYTVTLNELKAIFKVNAQARQSGAVNKT
jgi:aryl-phospho-beta-D-glucosidase BglC (GH1 family)